MNSTTGAIKKLTSKEKEDLLKEILGHQYSNAGNNTPLLNKVIDFVNIADNLFTNTELITYTNTLITSSRFVTAVASGASILSIALLPVSNIISVLNAWQAGHRAYAYRSVSYVLTSWVFDRPIPVASPTILRNIRSGGLVRTPSLIQEYNNVWLDASRKILNKINSEVISTHVPKDAIKIILRAFADNNEQKLCDMLLRNFESQFDPIPVITWKSNYKIKYPM